MLTLWIWRQEEEDGLSAKATHFIMTTIVKEINGDLLANIT